MPKQSIETTKTLKRKSGAVVINAEAEFGGKQYVDIRFFYEDKATKELKPTAKGVMLTHTEFRKIAKYFEELDADPVQGKRMKKNRLAEKEA